MGFTSILSFAHQLVKERVTNGDAVIDATVGNGNDTLLLAKLVGESGAVFGFDIQPEALRQTTERFYKENAPLSAVHLFLDNHAKLRELLPAEYHGRIAAAMFNLGYLPGYDHTTVTQTATTIAALQSAAELLRKGGVITTVLYTGHDGGQAEADAVMEWASTLPQHQYQSLQYSFTNQKNNPPFLVAVEKRA